MYTSHVVLRGTYLPATTRCASGHRHRYPSYSGPGELVDALKINCFADVRVNAYLLGVGPTTLTVIVEDSFYADKGGDEDYGPEQVESRRSAYERALTEGGLFEFDEPLRGGRLPGGRITGPIRFHHAASFIVEGEDEDPAAGIIRGPNRLVAAGLPGGIGGMEVVLFIGPSYSTSIEAWEVRYTWDVQRRDDGAVVAIHPYRGWYGPEAYGVKLEMELPELTQAVMAAHRERVAEYGGRIGPDPDLPMLVTDANRLRQYLSDPKVGAYALGSPTPVPPVPVYAPASATLMATGSDEDTANLSWGAVSGAAGYHVQHREAGETTYSIYYAISGSGGRGHQVHRRKDGEDRWTTTAASATGATHTVTGLRCGRTYEFRVGARGDGTMHNTRAGLWSPTATATLDSCARHQPQSRDDSHSFEVEAGASVGNSVGVVSTIDVNEDPITRAIAATTARQP